LPHRKLSDELIFKGNPGKKVKEKAQPHYSVSQEKKEKEFREVHQLGNT
jgi:hypothetical protein